MMKISEIHTKDKVIYIILIIIISLLTIQLLKKKSLVESPQVALSKKIGAFMTKEFMPCQKEYLLVKNDILKNKFDKDLIQKTKKTCRTASINIENIKIPTVFEKDLYKALTDLKNNLAESCSYQEIAMTNLEKTDGDYSYHGPFYKKYKKNDKLYFQNYMQIPNLITSIKIETRLIKK